MNCDPYLEYACILNNFNEDWITLMVHVRCHYNPQLMVDPSSIPFEKSINCLLIWFLFISIYFFYTSRIFSRGLMSV